VAPLQVDTTLPPVRRALRTPKRMLLMTAMFMFPFWGPSLPVLVFARLGSWHWLLAVAVVAVPSSVLVTAAAVWLAGAFDRELDALAVHERPRFAFVAELFAVTRWAWLVGALPISFFVFCLAFAWLRLRP
jgi:hypothetical protein